MNILIIFSILLISSVSLRAGVFAKNSQRIVKIVSSTGSGTGFFYTPEIIITNRHVAIKEDNQITPNLLLPYKSSPITDYKKIVCSNVADLCLIYLKTAFPNIDLLPLGEAKVEPGEKVFIIGHPKGLQFPVLSDGIISSELVSFPSSENHSRTDENYIGFTTNASISPGSSGSPVFSKDGTLLGIATGYLRDAQNLNIVIGWQELLKLINEEANNSKLVSEFKPNKMEIKNRVTTLDESIVPKIHCSTPYHQIKITIEKGILKYTALSSHGKLPSLILKNGTVENTKLRDRDQNDLIFINKNYSYTLRKIISYKGLSKSPEMKLIVKKDQKVLKSWNCKQD